MFGAPLRFEQHADQLLLDDATLALPHLHRDPALHELFAQQLGGGDDFLARCRAVLSYGDTTIEALASELAMSRRSVQRRLAASGTSFRELLDRVRTALDELLAEAMQLAARN